MKYDNELLMPIELWIDAITLNSQWNEINGGGWGWIHPDCDPATEIPDSVKYRWDLEFEEGTDISLILHTVKLALRDDVSKMFPESVDLKIVKAFLYAEHAHPSSDKFKREQKMDEVAVFLRFTGVEGDVVDVERVHKQ